MPQATFASASTSARLTSRLGPCAGRDRMGCFARRRRSLQVCGHHYPRLVSVCSAAVMAGVRSDAHQRQPGQHLVEGDGEVAYANAASVEDRICNRRAGSANADLADAFDSQDVGLIVEVVE